MYTFIIKSRARRGQISQAEDRIRMIACDENLDVESRVRLQNVIPLIGALQKKFNLSFSTLMRGIFHEVDLMWRALEPSFDDFNYKRKISEITRVLGPQVTFASEIYLPAIICAIHAIRIADAVNITSVEIEYRCSEIILLSGEGGSKAVVENSAMHYMLCSHYGPGYADLSHQSKLYVHQFIDQKSKVKGVARHVYVTDGLKFGVDWTRIGLGEIYSTKVKNLTLAAWYTFSVLCAVLIAITFLVLFDLNDLNLLAIVVLMPAILDRSITWAETTISRDKLNRVAASFDYREKGLPFNVVIAVPIIFNAWDDIYESLSTLAINAIIANDSNVKFVVLSDLTDSSFDPGCEVDKYFCCRMIEAIARINDELGPSYADCITFSHRLRKYSVVERKWMGENRKVGKLKLLSEYIVSGKSEFFEVGENFSNFAGNAKFVMVLDQDSILSRDCVHVLAGALNHPAHLVDIRKGRVVAGHGIAVPQLFVKSFSMKNWRLPEAVTQGLANASDLTNTTSPAYNMFGESGYYGKGMFDPAVYLEVFPSIQADKALSHDTIEADILRPCFIGTHCVMDSFPQDPFTQLLRDERWARGDFINLLFRCIGRPNSGTKRVELLGAMVIVRQCLSWVSLAALFPYILFVALSSINLKSAFLYLICWFYIELFRFLCYVTKTISEGGRALGQFSKQDW
ncbi:hypothetical protein [Xanthomonas vesicatoria]|uniref:hypothetical protein n=1 Tax=Xanthomonas vesicatoria TaxID=56460 RepID=UPI000AD4440C|nr:hypothetical protein [Xanthomonas vesicatoria]